MEPPDGALTGSAGRRPAAGATRTSAGPAGRLALAATRWAAGRTLAAVAGPQWRRPLVARDLGFAAGTGGFHAAGAEGFHGASVARPYGYNAYGGYHSGWVHGYWNGQNSAAWGWRSPYWGWGAGAGLGRGPGAGLGPVVLGIRVGPLRHGLLALRQSVLRSMPHGGRVLVPLRLFAADQHGERPGGSRRSPSPAMTLFDAGRSSFMQGNYAEALQQTDDALAKLPNDTTLHEFRGLCLFALGRYDEAAVPLYAVLSVGPGWDWTTLIGLYPNIDVYTTQQRTLEQYSPTIPTSATARFVLAYHYLTQGHIEAAVKELKQVVALNPGDTLSAKLLRQLDPPGQLSRRRPRPPPTTPPRPPERRSLATGRPRPHPTRVSRSPFSQGVNSPGR